jgi:hypothetical protein
MGNGIQITGLSTSFDLAAANFNSNVSALFYRGTAVERATADLPASTANAVLFNITGGRILLTGILGEVTTVIETQACNTKLTFNPTVAGSAVDICANLDITAAAVGTLFTITGTAANAMVSGLGLVAMASPWVLQPGAIELDTAATNTGQVKWKVWYMPLDTGATVAAA